MSDPRDTHNSAPLANAHAQTQAQSMSEGESLVLGGLAKSSAVDSSASHLLQAMFDSVLVVNEQGIITLINAAAETLFGIKANSFVGQSIKALLSSDITALDLNRAEVVSLPMESTQRIFEFNTIDVKNADGILLNLRTRCYQHISEGSTKAVYIFKDVIGKSEPPAIADSSFDPFIKLTSLAPVGILHLDDELRALYANEKWYEITQLSSAQIEGRGWLQGIKASDRDKVLKKLQSGIESDLNFHLEFRLTTDQEDEVWVKANVRPLRASNHTASSTHLISGVLLSLDDISQYRTLERRLRKIAEYDQLTGLVNRPFFFEYLEKTLKNESSGMVAVLFIDLDGFKEINDSLGHDVGDVLLASVARSIRSSAADEDMVARLGGDEFIVVRTAVADSNEAASLANKIIRTLQQPIQIDEHELTISASIGIAMANGNDTDPHTIVKHADVAVYQAKDRGRNNYQFYTSDLSVQARVRAFVYSNVQKALEHNEFRLVYQPQFNINSGKLVGFEALLRWVHPRAGELSPDLFIPMLEEIELIKPVGRWVIREVCLQLRRWLSAGLSTSNLFVMSINLSAKELSDTDLPRYVGDCLAKYDLAADSLIIEITETALLEESEEHHQVLNNLRSLGIKIALDDFGTGYSSLSHLKRYPIDQIKIDRSFIQHLQINSDDRGITQAILALAKSLNISVIAEGVENHETLELLKQMECSLCQGFLFSEPLSAKLIEQKILQPLRAGESLIDVNPPQVKPI